MAKDAFKEIDLDEEFEFYKEELPNGAKTPANNGDGIQPQTPTAENQLTPSFFNLGMLADLTPSIHNLFPLPMQGAGLNRAAMDCATPLLDGSPTSPLSKPSSPVDHQLIAALSVLKNTPDDKAAKWIKSPAGSPYLLMPSLDDDASKRGRRRRPPCDPALTRVQHQKEISAFSHGICDYIQIGESRISGQKGAFLYDPYRQLQYPDGRISVGQILGYYAMGAEILC